MTAIPFPDPRPARGAVRVLTVAPPATDAPEMPVQQAQAALALDFGAPELPGDPGLRIVTRQERELDGFAIRFAQAVVEVIAGDRGVHQLMRWTTEEVYDDLLRRTHALQRAGDPRRPRLRSTVRSVHLSRPQDDAAELSIHVRHGQRSRAIAARIEHLEGRWRCAALEFG